MNALEYMHSKQIIHRDLKPSNIMITHIGQNVKIIDFGLSDSDAFFILKHPAGTTGFIAPEQFMPDAKAEPRTDIFSLGMVIAEIATSIGDKNWRELLKYALPTIPCCAQAALRSCAKTIRKASEPKYHHISWLHSLSLGCSHWHILLSSAPSDQTKRSHYGAVHRRR